MKRKNTRIIYFVTFLIVVTSLLGVVFSNYIIQTYYGVKIIYYFNKNRLDLSLYYIENIDNTFFFFINQKSYLLLDKLLIYLLIKDYEDSKVILDRLSYLNLDKNLQTNYFLYKGLYYMMLHNNLKAFEMFKKALILNPDNKKAKIYLETLFKIKNTNNPEFTNKMNNNAEKKIKNLIIEKIINSNEINGFQNYKKYINKKNKNENKNYW